MMIWRQTGDKLKAKGQANRLRRKSNGEEGVEDGESELSRGRNQSHQHLSGNGRRVILVRFLLYRTDQMPQPQLETTRRTLFL